MNQNQTEKNLGLEWRSFADSADLADISHLFQRDDFGRGVDVGHHIGSESWIKKWTTDHILAARDTILSSQKGNEQEKIKYQKAFAILSQYMIQETREGKTYNAYVYDPAIMSALGSWNKRGILEKITGHYFHGVGRLQSHIENILNRIFAKPSDLILIPDFDKIKENIEYSHAWWIEKGFSESDQLWAWLIDTIQRIELMDPQSDDCAEIVREIAMRLLALYSHAEDVQIDIKKHKYEIKPTDA